MQKKIRNAQLQKVPFMVIAGDDDVEAGAVSFRYRDGDQDNGVPVDEAIARVVEAVDAAGRRSDATPTASRQDGVGRARRPRPAVDAAPDGLHLGREQAARRVRRASARSAGSPALDDEEGLVVHRGESAFVVLNLYPYSPGHLMVCPYRHVADYTELDRGGDRRGRRSSPRQAMRVVRAVSGAHGFNIGMNQGAIAGAGIAAHLHQHVVPRWGGDQNFMPIIGRTKTLPQLLTETRALLAEAWSCSADAPAGSLSRAMLERFRAFWTKVFTPVVRPAAPPRASAPTR